MEPAAAMVVQLREIIGHCAGIERTIAEIYASFAERWPQLPFGELWRELANEELVHGALLDNAACLPAAKQEEASIDASKLKTIRDRVVKRFPTLRTTLDQAFHTALDLEELELGNIYRRLLALTTDDSRSANTVTMKNVCSPRSKSTVKIPRCSSERFKPASGWFADGAADSRVRVSKA